MSTAIVKADPVDLQAEATSILSVIARAASDASVDVAKLERLLAIQERMLADQRRISYMAAMARLQERLPQITKAGTISDREGNVRNRFAKLEDIDVAIRPLCAAEGFSFSFDSKALPGNLTEFSCALSHRDGHSETKTLVMAQDTGGGRSVAQSAGSTISYARRYLLGMHLHLVTRDIDNDGAGESPRITPAQVDELRQALIDAGASESKFLLFLKVSALEDVTEAMFRPALMSIAETRKARAAR